MKKNYIFKSVLTALFVALALVVNLYTGTLINIFGFPTLKIGFGSIFSAIPAILFGPLFGAISSGMTDVVGFFMKPMGSFNPLITLTAVTGGFLRGFFWKLFKRKNVKNTNIIYIISVLVLLALGITNHVMLEFYPDSAWSGMLNMLSKNNREIVIFLVDSMAVIGLVFYLLNHIIVLLTRDERVHQNLLKLLIALGMAGLIQTTLNTIILKFMFDWNMTTFYMSWAVRLIEEIFISVIKAFIISYVIIFYEKSLGKKLG